MTVTAVAAARRAESEELERLQQLVTQLQTALHTRVAIEQAKGVLMERFGLNPEQAFELLRRAARNHRQSLQTLAALVTATRSTPPEIAATLRNIPQGRHRAHLAPVPEHPDAASTP